MTGVAVLAGLAGCGREEKEAGVGARPAGEGTNSPDGAQTQPQAPQEQAGAGQSQTEKAQTPAQKTAEPAQASQHASQTEPASQSAQPLPDLLVAEGGSPARLVEKTLEGLGGIKRFVKPGNKVVLKPNIAWYRTPEQAANTNPDIVAAVVRLCLGAGAKSVTVVEQTRDPWQACFQASGIQKAVEQAGGRIYAATRKEMYSEVPVPRGKAIDRESIVSDILQADVFINIPIVKVHDSAVAVGGMKNLMGTVFRPGSYHVNLRGGLQQCIADLSTVVRPNLIIADCYRVLVTGGPKGPGRVDTPGKVVAGIDPVAVDSYCMRFLNLKPEDVPHIKLAHQAGVGQMDTSHFRIQTVSA